MSAKQAKRLRQAARGLVVTLDQAGRTIHERGLMAFEHKRASPSSVSFRSDVPPKELVDDPNEVFAVTAVNRADSLRGIIRTLKKGVKSGKVKNLPQPPHKRPQIIVPIEQ
jgi:indole-3-glycerol phosphate synthase